MKILPVAAESTHAGRQTDKRTYIYEAKSAFVTMQKCPTNDRHSLVSPMLVTESSTLIAHKIQACALNKVQDKQTVHVTECKARPHKTSN
jgi:hypothetical protein